jgi:aminoglycoside phosphotransferase
VNQSPQQHHAAQLDSQTKTSDDRTLTDTTFTKAMDVRPFFNIYSVDTSKKWPAERIWNEATALELIRGNTRIPVPRVLDVGQNNDGTYLTVERVDGIELTSVKNICRQAPTNGSNGYPPAGHTQKQCTACQTIANQNAERFITEFMLPELRRLTSSQTGLNGTVIPSPWVTEYDRRETWTSKTSTWQSFVFCHGDLGPQNLMCNPVTLQIQWVVDWENAGYFEEQFLDLWAVDRDKYLDLYEYGDRLAWQIALLEGMSE